MELLKSRKTAAAVLAAVIIILTPLGSVISLNRLAGGVEDMFFEGVAIEENGSKYTSASIESLLEEKAKAALGLITVGANYDSLSSLTDGLRSARAQLMEAGSISEKSEANLALEKAWQALYDGIISAGVSENDLENAKAYAKNLEDIQGSISVNRYNDKVAQFREETLGRFPANIFGAFISSDSPAYFGE